MAGGSHSGGGPNIDLVPILDAMTAVIFFLVLSGTFIEYTKITVPPSQVFVSSVPSKTPALSPQMFAVIEGSRINLILKWGGLAPDSMTKSVLRQPLDKRNAELQASATELIQTFKAKFSDEKSLQLGFSRVTNYQEVISIIDGVMPLLPDIVLLSYEDEKNFTALNSASQSL